LSRWSSVSFAEVDISVFGIPSRLYGVKRKWEHHVTLREPILFLHDYMLFPFNKY
jgi:hypothetical protein